MAQEKLGVSCEVIDLQTILPWDVDTVCKVTAHDTYKYSEYCSLLHSLFCTPHPFAFSIAV